MQYSQKSEHKVYAILLFLLWPFLSVFIAFYKYKSSWAKNIVWFFVAFYGYNMVISNEGIDANRYRDKFIEMATTKTSTNILTDLYAEDSNNVDLLQPLLTYIVSIFTDNYKVLFLVYGLVFGYFLSRNLWLLFDRANGVLSTVSILLLVIFFIINPIWNINGFRFYAAAQIFVYGCLTFFLERKKSGVLVAISSVLVHFSFFLPLLVLFIYFLIGNKQKMYFYFFLISLFVSELNLESVRNNLLIISPVVFEDRIEGYTNKEYKENIDNSYVFSNWYIKYKSESLRYSLYLLLIGLHWRRNSFRNNTALFKLFCYVLLFYSIANIVSSVPSANRYIEVASVLAIALVFFIIQFKDDKNIDIIVKVTAPALLVFFMVTIRLGLDTIGLTTILGNPIIALFMNDDVALINLIK